MSSPGNPLRAVLALVPLVLAAATPAVLHAAGSARRPAAARAGEAEAEAEAAAAPLRIQIRPASGISPGSPLVAVVKAREAVASCSLRAGSEDVPLHAAADGRTYTGVLGIDLESPPAPLHLEARCRPAAVEAAELVAARSIPVGKSAYRVERLKVARKYVEPSPEAQARIAAERERMEAVVAERTPLPPGGLALALPVRAASRNFGVRRVFNGVPRSPHSGADFLVGLGTPVAAAGPGRVVIAGDLYFSGNTVVVDHGGGVITLYAHLERIDVSEGDDVVTGDRVGIVGATGRVTGPHLHFAARVLGARVDPVRLVKLLAGSPAD